MCISINIYTYINILVSVSGYMYIAFDCIFLIKGMQACKKATQGRSYQQSNYTHKHVSLWANEAIDNCCRNGQQEIDDKGFAISESQTEICHIYIHIHKCVWVYTYTHIL